MGWVPAFVAGLVVGLAILAVCGLVSIARDWMENAAARRRIAARRRARR